MLVNSCSKKDNGNKRNNREKDIWTHLTKLLISQKRQPWKKT